MERFLKLVTFEHSVFALPFALTGFVLAWRLGPLDGEVNFGLTLVLVILAAVSARTAAMGFNRLVDLDFDRENPRTASRELVTGVVRRGEAKVLVLLASGAFLLCAYLLGEHCALLAPFVLGYLLLYSYAKRFSAAAHLVLGGALALAPGGAWWVLRPQVETAPLLLMGTVLFWVGGFDILYSCQDEGFDRERGLFSIPAKLGVSRALQLSRLCHLVSLALLVGVGVTLKFSTEHFIGLLPVAGMFLYQYSLVSAEDLSRVNRAFFTVNGWVSVYYFFLSLCTGFPK